MVSEKKLAKIVTPACKKFEEFAKSKGDMDVEAFAVLLSRYDALSLPGTDWILRDDVIKTLLADRGAEEVARLLWSLRKVDGMEHDATVLHKCLGIYFDKKPRTILDAWRNLQLPPQELFEVLKLNRRSGSPSTSHS